MSASWREFSGWTCESCGEKNIIVECESERIDEAAVFERSCTLCGVTAPSAAIRPAHTAYRITTPREFYPREFYASRSR